VSRSMRPDELSSVLKQARLESTDFKIYVDATQENKSSAVNRGVSPSTPKRSRTEVPVQDSSFGDLSPIQSGVTVTPLSIGVDSHEGADTLAPLQTTPKRRRSLRSTAPTSIGSRSLTDLFSAVREETLNHMDDEDSTVVHHHRSSRSGGRQSTVSRSVDFTSRILYTPPRTRSQRARSTPPPAPRKKPLAERQTVEEMSTSLPTPRRLDFSNFNNANFDANDADPPPAPVSFHIDYGAVMGIVGFVSSYLVRLDTSTSSSSFEELVEFLSTVSVTHRSKSSATEILRSLIAAVPEWVMETDNSSSQIVVFNRSIKTFDVLSRLRAMKRRVNLLLLEPLRNQE
jgi:hypothetical protein